MDNRALTFSFSLVLSALLCVAGLADNSSRDPRRRLLKSNQPIQFYYPNSVDVKKVPGSGDGSADGSGNGGGANGGYGAGGDSSGSGGNGSGSSFSLGGGSIFGGKGGAGNANGSSAGNGSNNGGQGDPDENNTGSGDTGGPIGGGGGKAGGPAGKAEAFPQFYPMCLFVDPTVNPPGAVNDTIKKMVKAVAACNVNLVVYARTVDPSSYPHGDPEDHTVVNQLQDKACNLVPKLAPATRSSTSFCVNNQYMADAMCGSTRPKPKPYDTPKDWDKTGVAGCAMLNASPQGAADVKAWKAALYAKAYPSNGKPGDPDAQARWKEITDGEGSGEISSAPVAHSIEDTGSCDFRTVSHEAIGHSMFGHPNGSGDGFGIGFNKGENGPSDWNSGTGCEYIRMNAFPNPGKYKYNPNQQVYYREPRKLFNMRTDKVLPDPKNPPLAGKVTPPQLDTPPGRITFDDDAPKGVPDNGGKPSSGGSSSLPAASSGDRHTRPPTTLLLSAATGPGKKPGGGANDPDGDTSIKMNPDPAPPPGRGKSAPKVGFDDDAPKGDVPGYNGKGSLGFPKGDPAPGDITYGITDSSTGFAPHDSPAAYSSQVNGGTGESGGAGGASIGFDDNAPAGGYAATGSYSPLGARGGPGKAAPAGAANGGAGTGSYSTVLAPADGGSSVLSDGFFSQIGQLPDEEKDENGKQRKGQRTTDRAGRLRGAQPTRGVTSVNAGTGESAGTTTDTLEEEH